MEKESLKIFLTFVDSATSNINLKHLNVRSVTDLQWLYNKGKLNSTTWFRITNTIKRVESKKDKNGRCFKKHRLQFGKKAALITIKNGNTSFKIQINSSKSSQFCLKMTQISWPWRQILSKERKREPKILKKPNVWKIKAITQWKKAIIKKLCNIIPLLYST